MSYLKSLREASMKSQFSFERKISVKRAKKLRKKGREVIWDSEEGTYVHFLTITNPKSKHKKKFNNFQ